MPPPPPPESEEQCGNCEKVLGENVRNCGLCTECRILVGDQYNRGERILDSRLLKSSGDDANLSFSPQGVLDPHSGRLPSGWRVEVRCLRVDAPSWRFALSHAWPEGGISILMDGQRLLLVRPKEENRG